MAITVSDIEQKEFVYKGAGYDPYDVDQYLDQICDEMVAMQDRIDALEAELEKAKQAAANAAVAVAPAAPEVKPAVEAPVAKTSETLESILMNAQRLSDEAIENAKRKAQDIEKEAEEKASGIVANAKEEKTTLQKELETLHTAAADYKKRFTELLEAQKDLLDESNSLFDNK